MAIPKAFQDIKSNRQAMVGAYDITPIRRFQPLPGRRVYGLYHPPCTDKAYQFTARSKGTSAPLFTFYTGHKVGGELLGLLGAALPPLETWEADVDGADGGSGGGGEKTALGVHPFNAALLRLLNLFFYRHEFDPTKPSGQMFADINRNPGEPQRQFAVRLNTVLVRHNETSTDLVAWLTTQVGNAPIRPYDFTVLHNHLAALPSPPSTIAIGSPY